MLPFPLVMDLSTLSRPVVRLEQHLYPARLGVVVWNLRTGEKWGYHASEVFPMQSSFKFPLGVAFLHEVDAGRLSLSKRIRISSERLSVPYSEFNDQVARKGAIEVTNRELLEAAVGSSDNTATDLLMQQIGGPGQVTRILRQLGIAGIRVDRYEKRLQMDYCGLKEFTASMITEDGMVAAINQVPESARKTALERNLADPRDCATPQAMADLLVRLDSGKLLSRKSTALLKGIMRESMTGANRLRAGLPKGATLTHKTGTGREVLGIRGVMVDLGIIETPTGQRLVVVAMFKNLGGSDVERERGIADLARWALKASPAR